jgi:hypothetical protein
MPAKTAPCFRLPLIHASQAAYDGSMTHERVTLSRKVREYFAEIGRRGGSSGRRELTPQQAKLMVAIREGKRAAKKQGKPPPKLTKQHRAILRQGR